MMNVGNIIDTFFRENMLRSSKFIYSVFKPKQLSKTNLISSSFVSTI